MTYNQNVFYRTSSGDNRKPNQSEAEKIWFENVKFISLLMECIATARFQQDKKRALGNLMAALQLSVDSSTSRKWESENIPKNNSFLVKAKQLINDYYEIEKNRISVVVRKPKQNKRAPNWEEKARSTGIHVSTPNLKQKKSVQTSKVGQQATDKTSLPRLSSSNRTEVSKRVASVAPSFRKKRR